MNILKFLSLSFIISFIFGCAATTTTKVETTSQNVNEVVKYEGPKARIAVASFECKAAKCYGEIGEGIKDVLVDALLKSGKFIVLERGEGFQAIQRELELAQSGYVQKNKVPQKGLMEGADILVVGSIVAFEPNAGGIGGGVGALISKVPLLGGVKVGKKEAYIAAVIRLIDVRTGRIISSTRVEGKASRFEIGGLGGLLAGSVGLGGALNVYKNTPMEKAIMVMIDNAVKAISKNVPENYYRYKEEGGIVKPVKETSFKPVTGTPSERAPAVIQEEETSKGLDITGAWHGRYYGHAGSGEWAWVIWKNPDGTYGGRLNTSGTYAGRNIPLKITLNGNKIKVGYVLGAPIPAGMQAAVTFSGVVKGNKMRGTWMFSNGMDSGKWDGIKGRTSLTPKLR